MSLKRIDKVFCLVVKDELEDYVLQELMGLKQNRLQWIGAFQKFLQGKNYRTYTVVTDIDDIVSLLEHALCSSTIIAQQISCPNQRPKRRVKSSITSITEERDDEETKAMIKMLLRIPNLKVTEEVCFNHYKEKHRTANEVRKVIKVRKTRARADMQKSVF